MRRFLTLFCIGFAFVAMTSGMAFAQEAADAAAQAAPAAPESVSLIGLFKAGGWAMYVLLFLSICGVGLIIYNFLMIREKAFLRPDLADELKPAMHNLHLDHAKKICDDNPTVITNIIYAGLERVDDEHLDPDAVKEAMEESSTEELAAPFVMINYLSIVATLSPMVGLLGTVSGMVKAFRAIAAQGMGQPQVLADNISEALITTASGLIVAIPAMFFYFFFKNRYGKIASRVSKLVGDLYYEMIRGIRRHAEG
ncbi:MotA/TolQ/ExbB proton channel family protein [Rubellicoccus peritrichatus]|uniref:MotA/TolQ/ExbB proton channel family protein n=1 Tax=Rubellicoccus peritrichatus TaxID=3080537 RepID=A0AAQ3LBZ6_9BACT|nr:MotA/TolQ/ExbB proton channel family protein [Puniceicoccus sp. CR14]WOO41602.1 MotA/TolQ/ExbB proton channel family protein [Puniceicoccus sp. CR14]